ncbi:MAG TPA: hypothetical protein VIY28_12930 [Pseudonocardiaceae bacterium]
MPYLVSGLAAAAGVVVLVALLARLAGSIHQAAAVVALSRAHVADRAGLLTARIAALRVQLAQRRGPRRVASNSHQTEAEGSPP